MLMTRILSAAAKRSAIYYRFKSYKNSSSRSMSKRLSCSNVVIRLSIRHCGDLASYKIGWQTRGHGLAQYSSRCPDTVRYKQCNHDILISKSARGCSLSDPRSCFTGVSNRRVSTLESIFSLNL